ncbi:hypothetical protein AHAS_Ahas01G0104400 [Arachis hypogaea]
MIASLKAMRNKTPRIWYFPFDFATGVLADSPISQLQNSYKGRWMPQTNNLEHVFVPIWEARDACVMHWGRCPSIAETSFRHTSPDPTNWGYYIYPEGLPKDLERLLLLAVFKMTFSILLDVDSVITF